MNGNKLKKNIFTMFINDINREMNAENLNNVEVSRILRKSPMESLTVFQKIERKITFFREVIEVFNIHSKGCKIFKALLLYEF